MIGPHTEFPVRPYQQSAHEYRGTPRKSQTECPNKKDLLEVASEQVVSAVAIADHLWPLCQSYPRELGGKIETIQIHNLVPRRDEVVYELLLRILTGVDFRDGPKLRIRTEQKVDGRAGPLEIVG